MRGVVLLCALLSIVSAHLDMNDPQLISDLQLMESSLFLQEDAGTYEEDEQVPAAFNMNTPTELLSLEEGALPPSPQNPPARGQVLRQCMNHCGGLCQQLCAKFKHLKVCNGCLRGCYKRCEVKEDVLIENKGMSETLSRNPHTPQSKNA